jgi:hypothetical protein
MDMKFSERIGVVRRVLQKDSMDEALKNALWNVVYETFWSRYAGYNQTTNNFREGQLLINLWKYHFNQPVDAFPEKFYSSLSRIREAYMASNWMSVYDFIEFVANCEAVSGSADAFRSRCNGVLEKHVSAYRFVDTTFAPITSEEEIVAVEQGLGHAGTFAPVATHLKTALARLADRSVPDYRNSVKESISAVEAASRIIAGDTKATLGDALKKIGIHPALQKGFGAIYGYTSDASGIRHALSDEADVTADDAKFFLVSCSAFVNYLIAKGSTGIAGK